MPVRRNRHGRRDIFDKETRRKPLAFAGDAHPVTLIYGDWLALSPFVRFSGVWNNAVERHRGCMVTTYYASNQLRSGRKSAPWVHAKRPPRQRVRSCRLTVLVTRGLAKSTVGQLCSHVDCFLVCRHPRRIAKAAKRGAVAAQLGPERLALNTTGQQVYIPCAEKKLNPEIPIDSKSVCKMRSAQSSVSD